MSSEHDQIISRLEQAVSDLNGMAVEMRPLGYPVAMAKLRKHAEGIRDALAYLRQYESKEQ